jgi:anti-sigma factor RsiW
MEEKLSQIDLEDLSAYMDGELTEPAMSRVKHLLQTSTVWKRALERLQAVDRAMEAYIAPAAPIDLAQRVLRKTTHAHAMARPSLRWMVPLTAVAAVVVALLVYGAINRPMRPKGSGAPPVAGGKAAPSVGAPTNTPAPGPDEDEDYDYPQVAVENLVEDHLDFFRDMGVVNDLDTIEAIYNQQTPGGGT